MLRLPHLVVVDDHRLDELVHPLMEHRLEHYFYKESSVLHLVHHPCGEEILYPLLDASLVDVLQNLDALNLDVHLPFLDVVHRLDVVADEVQLRQLKMDYFLDAEDVELR
jgi:hypothetical protein